MVTNLSSLNAYNFFSGNGISGKLYVPVKPAAVIYAQFDHISGIAAHGSQSGVSINKIQILNTLIDHLSRLKNTPSPDPSKSSQIDPEYADALIKNYQAQIKTAVQEAKTEPYALAGIEPQAGAIFSIDV